MKKLLAVLVILLALGIIPASAVTADEPLNYEVSRNLKYIKLYDCAYNGENYVVLGNRGTVLVSEDLTEWRQADIPYYSTSGFDLLNNRAVWNGKTFIITTTKALFISKDGYQWEEIPKDDPRLLDYGYFNEKDKLFIIPLPNGRLLRTSDFYRYYFGYEDNGKINRITCSNIDAQRQNSDAKEVRYYMVHDGKRYKYTVFPSDVDYGTGTQHLNISVEVTSDDGKPAENYSQTVIMASSRNYYITDANGEVRIYYMLREQDLQTENFRSYYHTLVSEDGIHFAESGSKLYFEEPQNIKLLEDGSVLVLTYNKIYSAKDGETFTEYAPPGGDIRYGDKRDINWTGKEWI